MISSVVKPKPPHGCMSAGVALWFGAWLIRNDITSPRTGEIYTGGDVIVVFFVVLIGAMVR